jgi:hydroxymethylglutaryl-CoA lyase
MTFVGCTNVVSLEDQDTIMNYAKPQQQRPPVAVTEVGTRDGFQAEPKFIETAVKAEIIDSLIAAGLRHIEATSFVSPRAVPQLADAHEMLSRLTRRKEAHIAALVPNARGAERALGAGVDEIVCFVSASETHNRTNLNSSIADSLANVAEVAKIVRGKVTMRGAVACAFGCPFEGEVPVEAALRVIDTYADLGFEALSLGDTTGMATPPHGHAARRSDSEASPQAADRAAFPQHARRRTRRT